MHIELPIGAFIAALLVLVPLPWHWRARNVPTLSMITWLFASNIIYAVNSLIWANNIRIVASIWCDIVTKVEIGATLALPACCLCLCIHLERIASVRIAQTSAAQKRGRLVFDLLLCWGFPMIYMALHYIVQGHRFDIIEDLGCRPAIYNSVQSILVVWIPPLLVTTLVFIFATLALRHFFMRRMTFARHLQNSNSALTSSRYFRLICMAVVQMFWGVLVTIINVYLTCRNGLRPWTDWADVHSNFSRVGVFPARLIPAEALHWAYFAWWVIPITSVLFFSFFSFGEDAMKEYQACISWVARNIFRRKDTDSYFKTKISLPSFVRKSTSPTSSSPTCKVDITVTTDTESNQCDTPYSLRTPKGFPSSSSSLDVPTPTTFASFSTHEPPSTYVVPFPSRQASEAYPLPTYC